MTWFTRCRRTLTVLRRLQLGHDADTVLRDDENRRAAEAGLTREQYLGSYFNPQWTLTGPGRFTLADEPPTWPGLDDAGHELVPDSALINEAAHYLTYLCTEHQRGSQPSAFVQDYIVDQLAAALRDRAAQFAALESADPQQ